MKPQVKNILTHVAAVVIMLIIACIYFSPALNGNVILQHDIQSSDAMRHQQMMVADSTGTIPNWNPAMFGGMPGYQTAVEPQHSVFTPLKSILIMRPFGVERNIGVLWLYLLGFYVAMIAFGCNPLLSLLGAVAFGLGSYNIIIIQAGHITKAWAISMVAPVLAGMFLCFRSIIFDEERKHRVHWRRLVWGGILFTIALGLQITFHHPQITYYTAIGGIIMGITYLVYALKDKWFKQFVYTVGVLLLGCLFAVGGNYRLLTSDLEYAKVTMRGGSEITVGPEAIGVKEKDDKKAESNNSGGLNLDYAFSWSYGVGETYTLLVPNAMGGSSNEKIDADNNLLKTAYKECAQYIADEAVKKGEIDASQAEQYAKQIEPIIKNGNGTKEQPGLNNQLKQQGAPFYWGGQPFTSGPVYFGVIIIFLFALGCIVVKGPERWWLIISTIIAIILSWGQNCMVINEFLFNHLPMFNKFRTPSMALVLANATMVIMAILALKVVFQSIAEASNASTKQKGNSEINDYDTVKRLNRALYWAGGIVAGLILIVLAVSGTFGFTNDHDMGQIVNSLVSERKAMFVRDSLRSLAFVLLAFATLWLYINKKIIKHSAVAIVILSLLIIIDLWGVDRRYLSKDNFVSKNNKEVKLKKESKEQYIDYAAKSFNDHNYRVIDYTIDKFNNAKASAFFNQIGGYSPAKLRRYQDLIDFYLGSDKAQDYANSCQIRPVGGTSSNPLLVVSEPYPVFDMLNTRYLVFSLPQQRIIANRDTIVYEPTPVRRTTALGNCWFVNETKMVKDANEEIVALNDFNPATTAIVDKSQWDGKIGEFSAPVAGDTIYQTYSYPSTPDSLFYKSSTKGDRLAVFSEVYYAPDWRVYIDGKPAEYFRVNYILRAMVIPAGEHDIMFVNEAPLLHRNDSITLIISLLMLAVMAGGLYMVYRKKKEK